MVLEGALTGHSIFLVGDFNAHLAKTSDTLRGLAGRNGLPDTNRLENLQLNLSFRNIFVNYKVLPAVHSEMFFEVSELFLAHPAIMSFLLLVTNCQCRQN